MRKFNESWQAAGIPEPEQTANSLKKFGLLSENETGKRISFGRFLDFYAANVPV
jgi:hypothetical protein